MNFMTFHSVGNVIIPTDELIFFREMDDSVVPPFLEPLSWSSFLDYPLINEQTDPKNSPV